MEIDIWFVLFSNPAQHTGTHTQTTITILSTRGGAADLYLRPLSEPYCASLVDLPDFIDTCFLSITVGSHMPTFFLTWPLATHFQLGLNPWHLNCSVWSLFCISSHSIWKSCRWPQTVNLDFTPCLLLSCCHEVIRLKARHLSLELQYLCFLTSWVWVCACQTFTVFEVLPVGLLILTFIGCPSWLWDSFQYLADWEKASLSCHSFW